MMTSAAWFSVTPEPIARAKALRMRKCWNAAAAQSTLDAGGAPEHDDAARLLIVFDLCCGCGGDAIQLASDFDLVVGIDSDEDSIAAARHNANIYGVADRCLFIHEDLFVTLKRLSSEGVAAALAPHVADSIKTKLARGGALVCGAHFGPPWGGPAYHFTPVFDLAAPLLSGLTIVDVLASLRGLTTNVALSLPRNVSARDVASLSTVLHEPSHADRAHSSASVLIELEQNLVNDKRKMVTAYFVAFVDRTRGINAAPSNERDDGAVFHASVNPAIIYNRFGIPADVLQRYIASVAAARQAQKRPRSNNSIPSP